ncbi:MAG: CDP-archaeol synthase [Polaribacter sp.]|jgi:phosphatidate cytidylyltransferase
MRNLLKRSFSGIIYVLIFITAILFSKESYIALITFFGFISILEFSKIIAFKNYVSYLIFPVTLFLLLNRQSSFVTAVLLGITLFSSFLLMLQLITKKQILYKDSRQKLGLTIRYVVFSMCFLVLLPFYKNIYHPYLMISLVSLIWINDSFAFIVGKNFGKQKLFVSVSPKKTVEGFFGGLLFTVLAALIISLINTDFTILHWIIIGVLLSVLGTIGDLVESKFKRQAKIKDSGNIMPGHGGILDRLDSLLFAAPFVYLFINYIF